jgi:hypothetical protein
MVYEFTPHGVVVSVSLIHFLLKENNAWSHAVLGQGYAMPLPIRNALLSGEAEWQIKNPNLLTITLVESQ